MGTKDNLIKEIYKVLEDVPVNTRNQVIQTIHNLYDENTVTPQGISYDPCIGLNPDMTDEDFDMVYSKMKTPENLLKFLECNLHKMSVDLTNLNGYLVNSVDDLYAVFECELYNKMTGRE